MFGFNKKSITASNNNDDEKIDGFKFNNFIKIVKNRNVVIKFYSGEVCTK